MFMPRRGGASSSPEMRGATSTLVKTLVGTYMQSGNKSVLSRPYFASLSDKMSTDGHVKSFGKAVLFSASCVGNDVVSLWLSVTSLLIHMALTFCFTHSWLFCLLH